MGRYDKHKIAQNNLKILGFGNIKYKPSVAEKNCYDNWEKYQPELEGYYDIPYFDGTTRIPDDLIRFCDKNQYSDDDKRTKTAGFFYDDFKFISLWNNPNKYIDELKKFDMVIAPDFSLYTDFPYVLQLYSHYKKQWLSAYWEQNGIIVIPDIAWGDDNSYSFCFDGIPINSTVCISTKGVARDKSWQGEDGLWQRGYDEMIERLFPENIICYGKFIGDSRGYDIIEFQTQQQKRWK